MRATSPIFWACAPTSPGLMLRSPRCWQRGSRTELHRVFHRARLISPGPRVAMPQVEVHPLAPARGRHVRDEWQLGEDLAQTPPLCAGPPICSRVPKGAGRAQAGERHGQHEPRVARGEARVVEGLHAKLCVAIAAREEAVQIGLQPLQRGHLQRHPVPHAGQDPQLQGNVDRGDRQRRPARAAPGRARLQKAPEARHVLALDVDLRVERAAGGPGGPARHGLRVDVTAGEPRHNLVRHEPRRRGLAHPQDPRPLAVVLVDVEVGRLPRTGGLPAHRGVHNAQAPAGYEGMEPPGDLRHEGVDGFHSDDAEAGGEVELRIDPAGHAKVQDKRRVDGGQRGPGRVGQDL
mmetsp:Transcript_21310/g.66671  ORF Transcript_21310/g.66671 Transcript_21310/m.66671 type:complete len:348 (+) Transcript_21310:1-1044(+)